MTLRYNLTGAERKRLVSVISEISGSPAKYLGAPSFAYQVGHVTIDRNGGVTFDDQADREERQALIDALASQGFTAEPKVDIASEPTEPAPAEADGLCISMPASLFSEAALQNLKGIVAAKGHLIRKALGVEKLPIEVDEAKVSFPWFAGTPTPDEAKAYDHFIRALCEMARNQKRVTAKEREDGNDKYAFRCFLLRLGFIGPEYKQERKILLRNLSGSSAFRMVPQRRMMVMQLPSKETLTLLRSSYPAGTRVELVRMDDPQAPPVGTKGTVQGVDDVGSILVDWDNGSCLNVAFGEDVCRKIEDEVQ